MRGLEVMGGLPSERWLFWQTDIDGSGALDRKELSARLRQPRADGGYGYDEYQVDDFFREADADDNGLIDKVGILESQIFLSMAWRLGVMASFLH